MDTKTRLKWSKRFAVTLGAIWLGMYAFTIYEGVSGKLNK